MKISSSIYARPMWEDGCWVSMTKFHLIMTKFYLMSLFSLKKSYKLRMNSNKIKKSGEQYSPFSPDFKIFLQNIKASQFSSFHNST